MSTVEVRQKVRSRKALAYAVSVGKLVRQPCESCAAPRAQAHHDDYGQPLNVRWLCAGCHSKLHNQKHPTTKTCEACGATYTPHPTKRERAKTCSPACRAWLISRKLTEKPVIPPWAKLDAAKAEQIRARHAAGGESMRALGREFGVHHSQISAVVRSQAWK